MMLLGDCGLNWHRSVQIQVRGDHLRRDLKEGLYRCVAAKIVNKGRVAYPRSETGRKTLREDGEKKCGVTSVHCCYTL